MNEETYQDELAALAADEATFVRLTMSGVVRDPSVPWKRIVVRPVQIKGQRQTQISFFDQRKDITKNFRGAEAAAQVREVLALPFSNITLESTVERIQIQRTKKGKLLVSRSQPAAVAPPSLSHNRVKDLPLPINQPDPFLEKIGIMSSLGQVKPSMQRKFTQINEFLRALEGTGELDKFDHSPLRILDCGCGSAYLTFAAYHYLNDILTLPATLVGIDGNAELVAKCNANSHDLGYADMRFEQTRIEDWQPDERPDIVLSLHACDTATDDALALAIRVEARVILSVPCCHQYLNGKIEADVMRPVLRYGIMRQRTADILTDTFRALILRILGYRSEIFEFVTPDQTSKNLMIRAVSGLSEGDAGLVAEYRQLKEFWEVTPYLETLLGERLTRYL
jgi:SAM-dependent methyltransferase